MKKVCLDSVSSTNDYLRRECGGVDDDVVVVADVQTAGRGAGQNRWESERGKNLLLSILIHPVYLKPSKQFLLSMAVSNAIRAVVGHDAEIKWPNDIYVGDRKICGILIENNLSAGRIKDCILGVGLNVNQTVFRSDAPNPVSLKQLTGSDHDRDEILNAILDGFSWECRQIETGREHEVREEYKQHLYRRMGWHQYRAGGEVFKARYHDVADDGRLYLTNEAGETENFGFKEIEFVI